MKKDRFWINVMDRIEDWLGRCIWWIVGHFQNIAIIVICLFSFGIGYIAGSWQTKQLAQCIEKNEEIINTLVKGDCVRYKIYWNADKTRSDSMLAIWTTKKGKR